MQIKPFYDPRTWTLTYLVWDEATKEAVVIDPVLDYDPLRVRVYDQSLRAVEEAIRAEGLALRWVLETHAHADHISGAARLRERTGAKVGIGEPIREVQAFFTGLFGMDTPADGAQFDRLFKDGDTLRVGGLEITAIATPGHTPACVTYRIGDALFTGDALFMPDFGTGRCDFPGGSAPDLYGSIQRLYALPDETRVFVGHDYQPGGRALAWETTIGASKAANLQIRGDTDRDTFVAFRQARDATLSPPNLIFQSIQCNINAGALPVGADGRPRLVLPMGVFGANG